MVGLSRWALVAACILVLWPDVAAAGGGEFPADGTRGLGRGGTGFTRADDPTVMLRNPALLADLWDDQAMLSSHLLLQDSCFHPYGVYGWDLGGAQANASDGSGQQTVSVVDLGDGTTLVRDPTDASGNAVVATDDSTGAPVGPGFSDERFAEVCFEGPNTFLPSAALTMKLADNVGIGLGFMPPETHALPQFGNTDGTVETGNGLRPAETRYFSSNRQVSYLSFLGAVGWRPTSWLRIGAGFQWSMVAFNSTTFSRTDDFRDPSSDLRVDAFGRDLFIPGVIASVHVVPTDSLDIAIGYKWQDSISSRAKLDFTSAPFGLEDPFNYSVGGTSYGLISTPTPNRTNNEAGEVRAPPIWSPQLSFGLRYADRLKPRPRDWKAAKEAAGRSVEDHMSSERFDIEVNGVIYFNGVREATDLLSQDVTLRAGGLAQDGTITDARVPVGDCLPDLTATECPEPRTIRRELGGITQYSLRVGGDYNIMPGLFSVRAGASYETRGHDVDFFDPTIYDMNKLGLHAGFTVRLAERTDLSFAYGLFLIESLNIRPPTTDEEPAATPLPRTIRGDAAQQTGLVFDPATGNPTGDFDGVARFEVPRSTRENRGPHFANAGEAFYNLSVLSVSVTQHF